MDGVDERALRIHRAAVVVDGHSDVFCDVANRRAVGETAVLARRHVPDWRAGGVDVVLTTLYVEEEHKPDRALRRAVALLGAALNDIAETPAVALCRTRTELDAAREAGRIAFVLGIEGGECVQDGLDSLRVFHELGARVFGFCWNQRNLLAEGVAESRGGGGLTGLGRRMAAEAGRLGIVLDVSHLTDRSFWDLLEASDGPVFASHSNARALCNHVRNLPDDQIKALAARGGTVGLNLVAKFVTEDEADADVDRALDHVDHIAGLVGVEHVALGPDYVDYLNYPRQGSLAPPTKYVFPRGLETITTLPKLTAGLLARGYDEAAVAGILGGNFLRVLGRVMPA